MGLSRVCGCCPESGASSTEGREGRASWAGARPCVNSSVRVDKPRGVQSWPRCGLWVVMRLLIQQASWCCCPEPGRLGSPGEGSKYPIIDQFSLSVHTGPRQRSGGDRPRWPQSLCCLVQSPLEQLGLAGPVPPPGTPAPLALSAVCGISPKAVSVPEACWLCPARISDCTQSFMR